MTQPRLCEVFIVGPLLAMRWTPRLGHGLGEHLRPARRWTFALSDDWARPWRWEYTAPGPRQRKINEGKYGR